MKRLAVLVLLLAVAACGGSGPSTSTTPTPVPTPSPAPAPAPAPTPQPSSLSGQVFVLHTTVAVSGITVKFLDGPNAGQTTTTDAGGTFRFTGIEAGNANLSASLPPDWAEARAGVTIDGPSRLNVFMQTVKPWEKNGGGNDVWTKPLWVQQVRVRAGYGGSSSNFIAFCGSSLVVNTIIGTFGGNSPGYDATFLTPNCTQMHTEFSNGVSWDFTEVR